MAQNKKLEAAHQRKAALPQRVCQLTECEIWFPYMRGKRFCSDSHRKKAQRDLKVVAVQCRHCQQENKYLLADILAANNKPKGKHNAKTTKTAEGTDASGMVSHGDG